MRSEKQLLLLLSVQFIVMSLAQMQEIFFFLYFFSTFTLFNLVGLLVDRTIYGDFDVKTFHLQSFIT